MTTHDAAILLVEIKKAMDKKFKPTLKDIGIMQGIVSRIKNHIPISEKQGSSLNAIYRKSQGDGEKVYHEMGYKL